MENQPMTEQYTEYFIIQTQLKTAESLVTLHINREIVYKSENGLLLML